MKWNMIMITQKKRKANYFYGYLPLNQKYSPVKNVLSIIMIHCIIFIIIINLSQNLDSYILNGCLKYYVLTTGCYMSPQFFLLYHIQVHVWCLLYKKNSSRPTINLRRLPNSLIHQQHPCTIFQLVTGYKVHMFMPCITVMGWTHIR